MQVEFPDLAKLSCNKLSLYGEIEIDLLTSKEIKEITKVIDEGTQRTREEYVKGKSTYTIDVEIFKPRRKANRIGLCFEIMVATKSQKPKASQSDIMKRFLTVLCDKKIELMDVTLEALFRYSTDSYESLMELPLQLPPAGKSKLEVRGIRIASSGTPELEYSHIIDLANDELAHYITLSVGKYEFAS